jgi:ATP-dependent Clp endopeptidase proteolytic subunit ClpP
LPAAAPDAPVNSAPGKITRCVAIDGVIGEKKATAAHVRDTLSVYGKGDLDVDLNSEGGAITEGIAIYHALRKHDGKVTVRVTGLAASMGSVILQAGDHRVISQGAYVMIHNPSLATAGESSDLRRGADLLEKMGEDLLDIYESRTGLARDKIQKMMNEETWLNATEAKALGFVDEIEESEACIELRAVAQLDQYKRTPDAVRAAAKSPGKLPAAKGKFMDEEEAKALRAELAAAKAENEKLKAKAESDDDEEKKEDAGDDEPHSEADDDEDEEKEAAKDKAAAQAAAVSTLVARGYIAPGEKAAALKMSPKAFARHSELLLKLGPVVPTGQIKPGKTTPTRTAELNDDEEKPVNEAERAYMRASGKTLAQVRDLSKLPKSQVTQVIYDFGTRKAV